MYVEWEFPGDPGRPCPLVLVHGGGGQGTDWLGTPDGRPGWASYLVQDGWPVYVVDRPGHGRSPRPPASTDSGPAPTVHIAAGVFAPGTDERHTQWPGEGGPDDPAVGQLAASSTPLPADLAAAQALDARRLVQLLEHTGPAVLVTHSLGALAGWLAADARPDLVRAVVAVEPPGPPFLSVPEMGLSLEWGLTAAPITYDPPVDAADRIDRAHPGSLTRLSGIPVAVVVAEASTMSGGSEPVVEFLRAVGVDAQLLRLADHGVHGNGHGLMMERNNQEALDVVLQWLEKALAGSVHGTEVSNGVHPRP
jgi:pimeloyl-ACP methyl ester carboxylesterase